MNMKRITRDDTEHGVEYYRASEVDAVLADQPTQQEPVAVTYKEVWEAMNALYAGDLKQVQIAIEMGSRKLYTTSPAQRTWVGLTDELRAGAEPMFFCGAKWAERILKEKNT